MLNDIFLISLFFAKVRNKNYSKEIFLTFLRTVKLCNNKMKKHAERGGFEPPVPFSRYTRSPGVPVKPLRHLSKNLAGNYTNNNSICQCLVLILYQNYNHCKLFANSLIFIVHSIRHLPEWQFLLLL
jgi:hypothetical protein